MGNMVDVFVNAILDNENEFTIDDVPEKWKAAVQEALNKIEI